MIDKYTVYCHTSPSGKRYIGITKQKVNRRWRSQGQGYKQSPAFYNAIKKYGWDSFLHEILYTDLTKEEAENKEIELIKYYRSDDRAYGYNIEHGGKTVGTLSESTKQKLREANLGKHPSEETRQLLSEISKKNYKPRKGFGGKGADNPFCGHKHTEETKKILSQKNSGENSAWYGKKHTQEEIQKISKSHKKKIAQYTLDGQLIAIYDSMTEAAKSIGVCLAAISMAHKENRTTGGFIWKLVEGGMS